MVGVARRRLIVGGAWLKEEHTPLSHFLAIVIEIDGEVEPCRHEINLFFRGIILVILNPIAESVERSQLIGTAIERDGTALVGWLAQSLHNDKIGIDILGIEQPLVVGGTTGRSPLLGP